jgi:hypothetical protein
LRLLFLAHLCITLAAAEVAYLVALEVQRAGQEAMAAAVMVRFITAEVVMLAAVQMEP